MWMRKTYSKIVRWSRRRMMLVCAIPIPPATLLIMISCSHGFDSALGFAQAKSTIIASTDSQNNSRTLRNVRVPTVSHFHRVERNFTSTHKHMHGTCDEGRRSNNGRIPRCALHAKLLAFFAHVRSGQRCSGKSLAMTNNRGQSSMTWDRFGIGKQRWIDGVSMRLMVCVCSVHGGLRRAAGVWNVLKKRCMQWRKVQCMFWELWLRRSSSFLQVVHHLVISAQKDSWIQIMIKFVSV